MPLYEYECQKCGHRFEKIQKFSDAPIKKCPECGGKVEKLLTAPAVHFKGSGFYGTDYAKKSDGGSSSKGPEDSGSSASAEPAADAKESKDSKTKPSKAESSDKKSHKK